MEWCQCVKFPASCPRAHRGEEGTAGRSHPGCPAGQVAITHRDGITELCTDGGTGQGVRPSFDSIWTWLWTCSRRASGSDGNVSQGLSRGVQATDTQAWEMNQSNRRNQLWLI